VEFIIQSGFASGPDSIHFVGQSLGVHVAGSAGYNVEQNLGSKIGRVTGLDAAGPFMSLLRYQDRISPDKGTFVDLIHTSVDFFGTPIALGTADFYANGGSAVAQSECFTLGQLYNKDGEYNAIEHLMLLCCCKV
jgi:hypothetical protein